MRSGEWWLIVALVAVLATPLLTPPWWIVTPERANAAFAFDQRLALALWLTALTALFVWASRVSVRARRIALGVLLVGCFLLPPLGSGDSFGAVGRSVGVPVGTDPYLTLPSGPVADEWLLAGSWTDLPTPYGPFWHAFPGWLYALTGSVPSAALLLRLVAALAAVGCVLFLSVATRVPAGLMALAPLLAFEAANNGHPDVLIVLLALVAWVCAGQRSRLVTGLALVAAIAIKPPAGLLVLAFLVTGTTRQRLLTTLIVGLGSVLVYAPSLVDGGLFAMFSTFSKVIVYAELAPFVALTWPVVSRLPLLDGQPPSPGLTLLTLRLLGILVAAVATVLAFRHRPRLGERIFLTALFAFIFIPSAYLQPWYLLWVIPLAAVVSPRHRPWIIVGVVTAWLVSYLFISTTIGYALGLAVALSGRWLQRWFGQRSVPVAPGAGSA